jgi:alpha-L-fucosidase
MTVPHWLTLTHDDAARLARLAARRPAVEWFRPAKLGVMVHWTPASIPAFAPLDGDIGQVARNNPEESAVHSPYAEWYWNAMRIPGSPTALHHAAVHGDKPYEAFVEQFLDIAETVDVTAWVEAAVCAGARYVVLVTKHHDGVLLWPSEHPNPFHTRWGTRRDLVGDFVNAARARGLRVGLYYSGGLDWTFEPGPSRNLLETLATVPTSDAYADYVLAHYRELVARYEPDYLWNDIAMPRLTGLLEFYEDYYARCPDGLINDRWLPMTELRAALATEPTLLAELVAEVRRDMRAPVPVHSDVATPEYATTQSDERWESVRGAGLSFGFNAGEDEGHILTFEKLTQLLSDTNAGGGNLLLNLAVRSDGSVCPRQAAAAAGVRPA